MNPIYITLATTARRIIAKCYIGVKTDEKCIIRYSHTEMWVLYDLNQLRVVYIPVTKCKLHNNHIAKIWGWKNESDKLTLGDTDVLLDAPKMATGVKWQSLPRNARGWPKAKYHFMQLTLSDLLGWYIKNS